MKKIVLLLVFTFTATALFSQNAKKEILLDENGKSITKEQFDKKIGPPDHTFAVTTLEDNDRIIKKLLLRREMGIIQQIDRFKIIAALEEITGKSIDSTQIIIINFFHERTSKNRTRTVQHYSSDKQYLKFLEENKNIAQFFITENGFKYRNKTVYNDLHENIEKMIFQYPFDSNYIIIRPNGHYFKHVGEYRQDLIPEIVKAEWTIETK